MYDPLAIEDDHDLVQESIPNLNKEQVDYFQYFDELPEGKTDIANDNEEIKEKAKITDDLEFKESKTAPKISSVNKEPVKRSRPNILKRKSPSPEKLDLLIKPDPPKPIQPQSLKKITIKEAVIRQCERCNASFEKLKDLKEHRKFHIGEKRKSSVYFNCATCNGAFTNIKLLKQHSEKVHNSVKINTCSDCKQSFPLQAQLNSHMKRCLEKRIIRCVRAPCQKYIEGGLTELERHIAQDHKEMIGHRGPSSRVIGIQHKKAQKPNIKYVCNNCNKTFQNLALHVKCKGEKNES